MIISNDVTWYDSASFHDTGGWVLVPLFKLGTSYTIMPVNASERQVPIISHSPILTQVAVKQFFARSTGKLFYHLLCQQFYFY